MWQTKSQSETIADSFEHSSPEHSSSERFISPDDFDLTGERSLAAERDMPATPEPAEVKDNDFLKALATIPVTQRKAALVDYLKAAVAEVLKLPPSEPINVRQGFTELGLDSLMAVDLKSRLEAGFGKTLSATLAFNYPDISSLSDYLAKEVIDLAAAGQPTAEQSVTVAEQTTELETLSEHELAALLDQELAAVGAP